MFQSLITVILTIFGLFVFGTLLMGLLQDIREFINEEILNKKKDDNDDW